MSATCALVRRTRSAAFSRTDWLMRSGLEHSRVALGEPR
jgi:hypothetical protein